MLEFPFEARWPPVDPNDDVARGFVLFGVSIEVLQSRCDLQDPLAACSQWIDNMPWIGIVGLVGPIYEGNRR